MNLICAENWLEFTERPHDHAIIGGGYIGLEMYDMKSNGRAREYGETEGFIKVVIDAETERILGATVLATEGAELVHMYVDLMNADTPYTVIRDAIHIHPTLAEAVQSVLTSFE